MSHPNRAYIAGLFDGEGCVKLYARKRKSDPSTYSPEFSLTVEISNTNKKVFMPYKNKYGGSIFSRTGTNGPIYIWSLWSNVAKHFLLDVLNYSIIKRNQINLAIKFQENLNKGSGGKNNFLSQKELTNLELNNKEQTISDSSCF